MPCTHSHIPASGSNPAWRRVIAPTAVLGSPCRTELGWGLRGLLGLLGLLRDEAEASRSLAVLVWHTAAAVSARSYERREACYPPITLWVYCSTVCLVYDMKSFRQLNGTNINLSLMGSNSLHH